ncbi:hypothetical protein IAR55_003226 [Kwoniella newhampshirensis]|uniref:Uncharacterized protein n=1 Tax=Kwoniella newhampshirensis TaxID=1651941 RepID=A0AAW0YWK8_9TREE
MRPANAQDHIELVGPFPAWFQELGKSNEPHLSRPHASDIPAVSRNKLTGRYSYLAHLGARQILGLAHQPFSYVDLKNTVEAGFDYWSGKLFTIRNEPMAMSQLIQDEIEFHFSHVPPTFPSWSPLTGNRETFCANVIIRVLHTNLSQYIFWLEARDAINRIENLGVGERRREGGPSEEVEKEFAILRDLAITMEIEAKVNRRLMYAGGPGKDHLQASLAKPFGVSENLVNDLRFKMKKPLEEVGNDSPLDAAFALLCLNEEESGWTGNAGGCVKQMAFEQACWDESSLKDKYPYAIQMVIGEHALAQSLVEALPPRHSTSASSSQSSVPRTLSVRLHIAQSALADALEVIPNQSRLCDRSSASSHCQAFWEAMEKCLTLNCRQMQLPEELVENLYPFMGASVEAPIWKPRSEAELDGGDATEAEDAVSSNGAGSSRSGSSRNGGEEEKISDLASPVFYVNRKEIKLWRKVFDPQGGTTTVSKSDDVLQMFRSLGFNVFSLGGSFVQLEPPDLAGPAWIMRIPHAKTLPEETYFLPLPSIGSALQGMYGWDISWFARKKDDPMPSAEQIGETTTENVNGDSLH